MTIEGRLTLGQLKLTFTTLSAVFTFDKEFLDATLETTSERQAQPLNGSSGLSVTSESGGKKLEDDECVSIDLKLDNNN